MPGFATEPEDDAAAIERMLAELVCCPQHVRGLQARAHIQTSP